MAKKSMKAAAAAGTSVFDQIASGAQYTQDTEGTKDVKDTQDTRDTKADKIPMERLNLKIPTEIKEYLTVAAAKASIRQRRSISLTEYLCELVKADMEKRNDQ